MISEVLILLVFPVLPVGERHDLGLNHRSLYPLSPLSLFIEQSKSIILHNAKEKNLGGVNEKSRKK